MSTVIMLTLANIRKSKSQAVNLLAVVLIAGFLLNLGLLLLINFGRFYEERSEEVLTPHAAILEDIASYSAEQTNYLSLYPGVTETEIQSVLAAMSDIKYNGDKMPGLFMMVKASETQKMNPLKLIGDYKPLNDSSIYLPLIMHTGGKLNLGDDFFISLQGKEYHYTIAGFTEEVYFGSSSITWYRFYLSDKSYEALKNSLPSSECILQTVRMSDKNLSDMLIKDYENKYRYEKAVMPGSFFEDSSFSNVRTSRTFLSDSTSIIFVALAAVILLVSLVTIRFRIHNSLEESMINTGVLKAMGYRNRQIIGSLMLQFVSIAAVGVLAGVGLSYLLLPFLSDILIIQTALIWKQSFDLSISSLTFLAIVAAVLITTFLTSLKIRKMHPLTALRGGIATHNFRKNPLPLEKSKASLSLLLALKSMFHSKKQMIMITVVIACVTFAAASGLSIYYNVGLHPDSFATLVAGEIPDAVFILKDPDAAANAMTDIKQSAGVAKSIYYCSNSVLVNDNTAMNIITDDFSLTRGKMLYKGRYPKHDNEIALSGKTAKQDNVSMGDTVTVTYNGIKKDYLITGLIQSMNDDGQALAMTTEGMKRLYMEYSPDQIYVYMTNPTDTSALIKEISDADGALFTSVLNMKKLIDVQLGGYGSIFAIISTAITFITFLVVILVLYMVLKASILRRRRELGIQKAVGFTTLQLMNQLALSFTPSIVIGTVIGCLMGIFGFNSIFVAMVQSMGIMTASLPPSLLLTTLLGISIILFSYVISLLIAFKIRDISPYTLVSE